MKTTSPSQSLQSGTTKEKPFLGFNIHSAADCPVNLSRIPRPLPAGGIFFCRQGQAEFYLDRKLYGIHAGEMGLAFPFSLLQLTNVSDDFAGFGIIADLSIFDDIRIPSFTNFYLLIKNRPCIPLSLDEQEMLIGLCRRILYTYDRVGHPFRKEVANSLFRVLYYEVGALYLRNKPVIREAQTTQDVLFRQFLVLASQYCCQHRTVEYYANELNITAHYLSDIVKARSNRTALTWIHGLVIRQAKNLLENSQFSIKQISDELEFPTPGFFSQFFKKRTGLTPRAFRNGGRCSNPQDDL
jgi:AraC-like DNA-binding protein